LDFGGVHWSHIKKAQASLHQLCKLCNLQAVKFRHLLGAVIYKSGSFTLSNIKAMLLAKIPMAIPKFVPALTPCQTRKTLKGMIILIVALHKE